ncbi:hypothetical protein Tco_0607904, partial [Tanacetum coccineum]
MISLIEILAIESLVGQVDYYTWWRSPKMDDGYSRDCGMIHHPLSCSQAPIDTQCLIGPLFGRANLSELQAVGVAGVSRFYLGWVGVVEGKGSLANMAGDEGAALTEASRVHCSVPGSVLCDNNRVVLAMCLTCGRAWKEVERGVPATVIFRIGLRWGSSKFLGAIRVSGYGSILWSLRGIEDFIFQIENKNTKKGNAMYYPRFTKLVVNFVMDKDPSIPRRNKVNWHYARDDPMFTTINVISRNEDTQLYGAILPVALTNEDIRNSESYKEYYAIASGTIPPKTKGSKKKANTDTITKQKPPTAPKEKKSGKGKQKTTELETISEADLTEAEQLKIITKRSRQETHSSHASGSGADEGTGVTPGVPDAPDYDSEDDISWKSSDDDQDDEQAQDDEDADKNDVNETTQDDEDDDEHDVDEKAQDDDDEEQTESDDDGDDFVHPKLTTHDDDIIHEEETDEDDSFDPTIHTPSRISSSDDEDSDNEVEGTNVEGAKSDEEATYEEDQGNEAVEDTNTDLDGRDDVMTDVILPQVQATQEIEDTHVTLTPVNPDGQQQSSSVSSGFVSNMLNPNQDTGVDDIFGQHTEATSLIDTPVTAIMEPSFTAQINRPPTPYPLVIQTQQPPILTPATTTSSSLQNLPNFASLFGFDYRLKALEDNFSELRQTNQYAEALSSIPGTVDQYLANKMQEAVDVAVQLKYDRIREESTTANQQFLDSIDDGMKKIIKEQVKKEVSKIIPKIEKLVTDQLESEVLVRSSKEANTSHAVAANLSELELKKILIDKMEANNSINRSDIQRQLYKVLVEAYEADKILLDTYGDTVTIKRPRDGADDDEEPSAGTDRGSKRRRSGKEPASTSAPSETTTKTAGRIPMSLKDLQTRSSKQVSKMNKQKKRRIIAVTMVEIDIDGHDFKHLDLITVRRDDDVLFKFKRRRLSQTKDPENEDMLLILCTKKSEKISAVERTYCIQCLLTNIKPEKTRRLYSILRSKTHDSDAVQGTDTLQGTAAYQ